MWWNINRDGTPPLWSRGILLPLIALPLLGAFFGRPEFALCLLFLVLYSIATIQHSRGVLPRGYALLLFGGLGWSLVALLTGSNRGEGIYGVLWQVLTLLAAYAVCTYFTRNQAATPGGVLFPLGVGLALQNYAVLALRRGVGSYPAQTGIPYANALAAVLLLALLAGIDRTATLPRGKPAFFLTLAGILLLLPALWLTQSRAVWALAALAVPAYLLLRLWRDDALYRRAVRFVGAGLLALPCIALLLVLIPPIRAWLLARIGSVTELSERFAYYHDSLGIVSRHPLFGLGTGGWASRQGEFQSALYATRFVHSSLFQSAVDGGIPALLLGGGVLLFPLVRGLRRVSEDRALLLPVASLLILFLHSLLDFDLSIPGVWLIYLFLSGYLLVRTREAPSRSAAGKLSLIAARTGLCLLLPVLLCLLLSQGFYLRGAGHYAAGDFAAADRALETAERFHPFDADIPYIRAHIANLREGAEAADALMQRAVSLDKNNYKYYNDLGYFYFQEENDTKSSENYSLAVDFQPLLREHYDHLRDSLTREAAQARARGDSAAAEDAEERLAALPARMEAAKQRFSYWTYRVQHTEELVPSIAK